MQSQSVSHKAKQRILSEKTGTWTAQLVFMTFSAFKWFGRDVKYPIKALLISSFGFPQSLTEKNKNSMCVHRQNFSNFAYPLFNFLVIKCSRIFSLCTYCHLYWQNNERATFDKIQVIFQQNHTFLQLLKNSYIYSRGLRFQIWFTSIYYILLNLYNVTW